MINILILKITKFYCHKHFKYISFKYFNLLNNKMTQKEEDNSS